MNFADKLRDRKRSESEKLRLIRKAFTKTNYGISLTAAEVAEVRNSLKCDHRLSKLSLAIIDATRDVEAAIEELLSGNMVTPHYVLTRFKWLYTTQALLNEETFLNLLFKLSNSAKLKFLYSIGKHVIDTDLGDRLWNLVNSKYTRNYSNRLLSACSNELIVREMTSNKGANITGPQILIILRRRFDSGVELVDMLLPLRKSQTWKVNMAECMSYIQRQNSSLGCSFMVRHGLLTSIGATRTRAILKGLPQGNNSMRAFDHVVKFLPALKEKTLKRYAPFELYKKCFVTRYLDSLDYECKVNFSPWLSNLSHNEKLQCLEALFLTKYGKRITDVPESVPPEMLYFLSEEDRIKVVSARLSKKDYGAARVTSLANGKHFWTAMMPPAEAFPQLKKLAITESQSERRMVFYELILLSATYRNDQDALAKHLEFVVRRGRNEDKQVHRRFLEILVEFYKSTPRMDMAMWPPIKELIELIIVNGGDSSDMYYLIFTALKNVPPKDREKLRDVSRTLANAHNYTAQTDTPKEFTDDFKRIRKSDHEFILTIVLEELESALKKHAKKSYSEISEMWPIYDIIYRLKVDIDFSKFPQSALYLKECIWMGGVLPHFNLDESIAYELTKDIFAYGKLPKRKATVAEGNGTDCSKQRPKFSKYHYFRKKVFKTRNVNDLSLIDILSVWKCNLSFFRRLVELLAMTYTLPHDYEQEAIELMSQVNLRKNAIIFLALHMPSDKFNAYFSRFYPTEATLTLGRYDTDLYDIQRDIIQAIVALGDARIGFEIALKFMKGDYLKHAISAFNHYCSRSPCDIVMPLLADKLDNYPVSARKHVLRWFFIYNSVDDTTKLQELAQSAKNGSIKLIILKAAYSMVTNRGESSWTALKVCLDSVTTDDRETFKFLIRTRSIDGELSDHLPDLFTKIFKLAEVDNSNKDYDTIFGRLEKAIGRLPADYAEHAFRHAFNFDFSAVRNALSYVESFVFSGIPQNITIFDDQFATTLGRGNKHDDRNISVFTKRICIRVIEDKMEKGAKFPLVLNFCHGALSNHCERFFAEIVYVKLIQVMADVTPIDHDNRANGKHITEFTRRGIAVIDDVLTERGLEMMAFLINHMLKIVKEFWSEIPNYELRMIQAYSDDMSDHQLTILVHILPYSMVRNGDPQALAIVDKIRQRNNVSVNIVIDRYTRLIRIV